MLKVVVPILAKSFRLKGTLPVSALLSILNYTIIEKFYLYTGAKSILKLCIGTQ